MDTLTTAPVPIQPLSVELVHRIAAGEVIDSLAAVVRELVDNALDAQATRISVTINPEVGEVQVADNGVGFTWPDLQAAAAPHTTSKLRHSTDLYCIQTLGFRGEALHSLAQVGQLEICSRPAQADAGWQVQYDRQGQVRAVKMVAIATGTIVTVTDIFQHWPARRQALPPPAQQLRAVQAVIHEQALCHPTLTWQAHQGDRPWFSIAPGPTAQAILPQLVATVQPGDLRYGSVPIPMDPVAATLELVVGLPDRCHRYRPDWVRVAVNGRCVQVISDDNTSASALRPLEQTILGAFRQTLPRHRFPLCFVHLHVDPSQVDWNRHPAKTEIYLHHLQQWRQQVATAIREALHLPAAETVAATQKVRQMMKVAEGTGVYQLQQAASLAATVETAETELGVGGVVAIAQLHQTYIVAEHPQGMWLIEQHIAHERVLYEQLQQNWQLIPVTPPLMLPDLSAQQVARLQEIGIDIDAFGHQLWAVRSAPQLLTQRDDLTAALVELSRCDDLNGAIVATACRSAIRNGTPLSRSEMQTLLDQWQRTQQPRTCPHGRPIFLAMEETDLARFFRRHWVIGKSHGI